MNKIIIFFIAFIILSCSDDPVTPPTTNTISCGKMPVGHPLNDVLGINDSIRIVAIMPNPAGEDDYNEYFILKNFGKQPLNLMNYVIKDDDNIIWDLPNVILNQCDSLKIVSNKTAQLLNSGDKVTLYIRLEPMALSPIQTVEYFDSESGIEERFDK